MDDLSSLASLRDDQRRMLLEEIGSGDEVLVVVPGVGKHVMAATNTRLIVWTGKEARSWSYDEVTGVDYKFGMLLSWAALRGPDLPAGDVDVGQISKYPNAIQIQGKALKPALQALEEAISERSRHATLPADYMRELRADSKDVGSLVGEDRLKLLYSAMGSHTPTLVREYTSGPMANMVAIFALEAEILGRHGYFPTSQAFIPNNALTGVATGTGRLIVTFVDLSRLATRDSQSGRATGEEGVSGS